MKKDEKKKKGNSKPVVSIKKLRANYNLTFDFDKRLQSYIKSFPREHKRVFKEDILLADGTTKSNWVSQIREVQMGNIISFLMDNSYPFVLENFTEDEMQRLRQLYLDRQRRIRKTLKAKADSIEIEDIDWSFMKIQPHDYQKQAVKFMELNDGNMMLGDEAGVGKAQDLDSLIMTQKGWVKMRNIKLKDQVLSSDGNFYPVTGIYPQGPKESYTVHFNDGTSTNCCNEHLWVVRDQNRRKRGAGWITKSLSEILESGLMLKRTPSRAKSGRKPVPKWEIPLVAPAQFEHKELPIEPYMLGCLIGDGYLAGKSICISIPDHQIEMLEHLEEKLPAGYHLGENRHSSCPQYYIRKKQNFAAGNLIKESVHKLKLNVLSGKKFIPKEYKLGSAHQRLELLRGLMDTDGGAYKKRTNYYTVSYRLACDVKELVQSLGGIAVIHKYDRTSESKSIEYSVNIRLHKEEIFKLKDKIKKSKGRTHFRTGKYIQSVEYRGMVEQQCIRVGSPDHTYVTNDYIVTHNTSPAFTYAIKHNLKTLVVCPASLKLNWKSEIEKFSSEKAFIYKYNPTKKSGKVNHPKDKALFHIINFESIQSFIKLQYKHKCHGNIYENGKNRTCGCEIISITKKLKDPCPECANVNSFKTRIKGLQYIIDKDETFLDPEDYDLLIIDEFHRIKEKKTDWTKIINKAFRDTIPKKVLLSGTAIKSRPIEIFMPLNLLDKDRWNSYHDFGVKFCAGFEDSFGWKYDGASNLEELYERISPFYLRRLKKDVLSQLPPKTYTEINLELDAKTKREYNKAVKEMAKFINEEGEEDEKEMSFLAKVHLLKKCTETYKLEQARDFVDDIIESKDKVVIFFDYIDTGKRIKQLWGDKAVIHTGQMNATQKQESVNSFQNNKNIHVFAGTFGSAGVGITLTAANKLIMIGQPWTTADRSQAEDRVHRASTKQDNVQIITFLCEDTVDMDIYELLQQKAQVVSKLLDNKDYVQDVNRSDASIISQLLERLR